MEGKGGAAQETVAFHLPCRSGRLEAIEDAAAAGLRAVPDWRGKTSLALGWKQVRERRGPLAGAWRVRLADGSLMSLPRGSTMSWTVAATGRWDHYIVHFVERFVAPHTLALDIGASLGLWTVPLARVVRGRDALVWCFEPNPENLPWLTSNIESNGLRSIAAVQPVAVGARQGTAHLGSREPGGGNGAITGHCSGTVEVEMKRLDDCDFPCPVSFVKLDVEGFELEVLRGACDLITRDRPVIFGEFNAAWLLQRGEDLPAHLHTLTKIGYDIFALEQRRSSRLRATDVVSLRRLRPPFGSIGENLVFIPS